MYIGIINNSLTFYQLAGKRIVVLAYYYIRIFCNHLRFLYKKLDIFSVQTSQFWQINNAVVNRFVKTYKFVKGEYYLYFKISEISISVNFPSHKCREKSNVIICIFSAGFIIAWFMIPRFLLDLRSEYGRHSLATLAGRSTLHRTRFILFCVGQCYISTQTRRYMYNIHRYLDSYF